MTEQCQECGAVFEVVLYDEDTEVKYCPCCGEEVDS